MIRLSKSVMHNKEVASSIKKENSLLVKKLTSSNSEERNSAYESLIINNLNLVYKIAHSMNHLPLQFEDRVSEGCLGLIKAVSKFKRSKGAAFGTYASYWIRESIQRASINQATTIRIPVTRQERINKLKKAYSKLEKSLGRAPANEELAEYSGFSIKQINDLSPFEMTIHSLFEKRENDNSFINTFADKNSPLPHSNIVDNESSAVLKITIDNLDEKEQTIICLRFGIKGQKPHSFQEISTKIGLSRERVRQINNESIKKLRKSLKARFDDVSVLLDNIGERALPL